MVKMILGEMKECPKTLYYVEFDINSIFQFNMAGYNKSVPALLTIDGGCWYVDNDDVYFTNYWEALAFSKKNKMGITKKTGWVGSTQWEKWMKDAIKCVR